MDGMAERLIQARARRFESASDAARAMNVPVPTYSGHENGNRGIPLDAASRYARFFRVSLDWLVFGRGPSSMGDPQEIEIPIVSWVSAGEMVRDEVSDASIGTVYARDLPAGDWIALRVEGSSMDKISPPGSIIFVNRRDKRLVPNALYVIADEDGNATYKRYRPNPDRFEPVSVDDSHEPIFPEGAVTIIGRVRRSTIDM
jgi:SOS-response transcriptional repressor LexA